MRCKFLQDIYLECFVIFRARTGSNLTQTLLSPPKVIWHPLFLLNESVAFLDAEHVAFRIKSFS